MTAQEALTLLHETGRAQGAVARLQQIVTEWSALGGKEPEPVTEPVADAPLLPATTAGEPQDVIAPAAAEAPPADAAATDADTSPSSSSFFSLKKSKKDAK